MSRLIVIAIIVMFGSSDLLAQSPIYKHVKLVNFFLLRANTPQTACPAEDLQVVLAYSDDAVTYRKAIRAYDGCIKDRALVAMETSYLDASKYLRDLGLPVAGEALKKFYLNKSMEFEASIPGLGESKLDERTRKLRVKELSLESAMYKREVEAELQKQ